MKRLLIALLCLGAICWADDTPQTACQGTSNESLLRRIDELESRIQKLEAQTQPGKPSPDQAHPQPTLRDSASAPAVAADEPMEHQKRGRGVLNQVPSTRLQVFSDVGWSAASHSGEHNSFALGQLDVFVTSRLSDKLSMLAEAVVESDTGNAFGIDLERLTVTYAHNDFFRFSVGRFHTSIGYYNTEYHHSSWMQTTTGRPFLFQFEDNGGPLPVHTVGISLTGRVPSGKWGLHYAAEAGNGRASTPSAEPVQNRVDENNRKAMNFAVFARPEWLPGLQTGFSVYHDKLQPAALPKIDENILAGHIVYRGARFEWLNEAVLVRHAVDGTSVVFDTPGWYTQISRQYRSVRPYFRYQYFNASDREPIYGGIGRLEGPSAGVRFDLAEKVAFKAQYDRNLRRSSKSSDGLVLQFSFAF
jgi:hypothetical protein